MTKNPDEAVTTTNPAAERLPHRRVISAVGIVAALALAAGVLVTLSRSDDEASPAATGTAPPDDATPPTSSTDASVPTESTPAIVSDTTAPSATPTTLPPEPLEPPDDLTAANAVGDLLTKTAEAINPATSSTPDSLPDLSQVATGAVLGELEATRAEFDTMGWTQVGTPVIAALRVVTPPTEAAPGDTVVEACLDNSDVRIVDSAGNDVRTPGTPTRSLNIYTLRWAEGRWLVAEHTFPNDPNC